VDISKGASRMDADPLVQARLRQAGFGRVLYHTWHRPRATLARCIAEGGPLEQWRTARGRHAMENAARALPPVSNEAVERPFKLHLLTGRRFWYQSAFCLWTFARHAGRALVPVIYDDGSLTGEFHAQLARLFPAARFVSQAEAMARLETHLPTSRFPFLRERWVRYPNIRKLTDPHLGSAGWRLVVDSDLLFFRTPHLLTKWLDQPAAPLHAIDSVTSYGYSQSLLETLAGAPVGERVNVGLCGLRSDRLDWEQLEYWCRTLIEREGTHYYLEQALVAMLVAGRRCTVAPAEDYVTLPRPPESHDCGAVMHHYVAESKRIYFRENWRRCLTQPRRDA